MSNKKEWKFWEDCEVQREDGSWTNVAVLLAQAEREINDKAEERVMGYFRRAVNIIKKEMPDIKEPHTLEDSYPITIVAQMIQAEEHLLVSTKQNE